MYFLDTQEIRLLKVALLLAVVLTCLAGCGRVVVTAADAQRAAHLCERHDGLDRISISLMTVLASCRSGQFFTFRSSQ